MTKILTPATFSQKYFNQQLHSISFCGIWCLGQIFVQPNYRAFPSMLLTWTFVILSNIWGVDHFFKVLRKIERMFNFHNHLSIKDYSGELPKQDGDQTCSGDWCFVSVCCWWGWTLMNWKYYAQKKTKNLGLKGQSNQFKR